MYRRDRSSILWRIIPALLLSAACTFLLHWAGAAAMTIALFFLLAIFFFYGTSLARVLWMTRRRIRPFGNAGGRGDWSGVREPRRPRPPYWPPRAAAVMPEDTEPPQPASPASYSDSPQHPLRLEDGLA
jgi:hypothetical protein